MELIKITEKLIKKLLFETGYELIKNYGIENLSVKDICTRSELSRTTFYRYFKDKNDLVNYIFDELVRKVIFSEEYKNNFYQQTLIALEIISNNKKFFKKAFNYHGQNSFIEYYFEDIKNYFEERFELFYNKRLSEKDQLEILYNASGIVSIVRNWINNNSEIKPTDLTNIIVDCLSSKLKKIIPLVDQEEISNL